MADGEWFVLQYDNTLNAFWLRTIIEFVVICLKLNQYTENNVMWNIMEGRLIYYFFLLLIINEYVSSITDSLTSVVDYDFPFLKGVLCP